MLCKYYFVRLYMNLMLNITIIRVRLHKKTLKYISCLIKIKNKTFRKEKNFEQIFKNIKERCTPEEANCSMLYC